jgi:hypothetical protein
MFIFKIWWMIAVLPVLIFFEINKKFSSFLKKRNIYHHWDSWHGGVIVLIILIIFLFVNGYR